MKPWTSTECGSGINCGTLLQWGHGDEAVEEDSIHSYSALISSGFNGATAMKPWKRKRERSTCQRSGIFNGATAMKPWKSR